MNAIDRSFRHKSQGDRAIELETWHSAPNYAPLPVVLTRGEGSYLWDTEGKRYLDMMSAYSAVSLGHAHPRILAALTAQANRLAVPSRAYYSDQLGPFLGDLRGSPGSTPSLPMNTGAEAVETADQGRAPLGLSRQGHRRRTRPRSSSPAATSTAAPRPSSASRPSRTIATASARSRPASRRCRSAISPRSSARSRPRHGGRADRADPGRGRHHRAAATAISRAAPASATAQRAAHPRRGAVRPRPHRQAGSPSSTRASGRTGSSSARRWAAACFRCPPSSAGAKS